MPGVFQVDRSDKRAKDFDSKESGRPCRKGNMFAGSKFTFRLGKLELVEGQPEMRSAGFLPRLESQRDAPGRGELAPLVKGLENRRPARVVRAPATKPACSDKSLKASRHCALNGPFKSLDSLGPECGVAETAGLFDRLRRGVILARKAEHRRPVVAIPDSSAAAGIPSPSSQLAWCGSPQAIRTCVDTQAVQEARLQFADALDLKAPATHAQ